MVDTLVGLHHESLRSIGCASRTSKVLAASTRHSGEDVSAHSPRAPPFGIHGNILMTKTSRTVKKSLYGCAEWVRFSNDKSTGWRRRAAEARTASPAEDHGCIVRRAQQRPSHGGHAVGYGKRCLREAPMGAHRHPLCDCEAIGASGAGVAALLKATSRGAIYPIYQVDVPGASWPSTALVDQSTR